ncbi:hypothetical protein OG444_40115 (plasmid) [Streptomyces sp. NBC_01232]|uniref:hypothetical protein n=1 Tax=Streptomyces sp. NBC_01232 TaxID=2903786 RepID=UPI002E0E970F|nr:hypothetical protein OG444_40115 [Streptomyces sp. NBC_01232]
MTTVHPASHQGQPAHQLPILTTSFDGFLTQAEHELSCRRREVRALRRRVRRQRRRELGLLRRTAYLVGKATAATLSMARAIAFLAATILLILGNFDAAKDTFALSAAAWGAATAVCAPLGSHCNHPLGGAHDAVPLSNPADISMSNGNSLRIVVRRVDVSAAQGFVSTERPRRGIAPGAVCDYVGQSAV